VRGGGDTKNQSKRNLSDSYGKRKRSRFYFRLVLGSRPVLNTFKGAGVAVGCMKRGTEFGVQRKAPQKTANRWGMGSEITEKGGDLGRGGYARGLEQRWGSPFVSGGQNATGGGPSPS